MLRKLSVRGKILAALALPVLVLFVASTFIAAQSIGQARSASQASAVVQALESQDAALLALAEERTVTILAERAVDGMAAKLPAARKTTDAALDARNEEFRDLDLSALDPRVRDAVDATLADGSSLKMLRTGIDQSDIGEREAILQYTGLIDDALDVPRMLADTSNDRELAQYLDAYVLVDDLVGQLALERPMAGAVLVAAKAGQSNPAEDLRAATLVTQGNTLADEARRALRELPASDLELPHLDGTYVGLRTNVASSSPGASTAPDVAQWDALSAKDITDTLAVRDDLRTETGDHAGSLATEATTRALITIAVTLLAFVASILVAALISRAIVRPLRHLTRAAEEVRDQLPTLVEQVTVPGQGPRMGIAEIRVESSDEVGQLAAAFNDVNSTTIKVAREQAALRGSIAEMFVNVARRDQVLLNRQLSFLDDLERTEEDPGTLSNLFRLDHLATRMRRNAESLLVLAGIDSGRRVRQPMPASDVIRTASSEIELYDRVRLNLVVDPLMLGHNALNAAHLIAELLENATMFSEPHTPVEVTTGRTDQFVQIKVRDHGLGMTPEEIADANKRVATHAASDIVGAQRLGLYVVGRLAERLSARVVFATGPDGSGTEVTVSFPAILFVPDSNVPLPQPTDPLDAPTQVAAGQYAPSVSTTAVEAPAAFAAPIAAPEPPVAAPVDLAALTDGTTSTGMPRRRSRGVDPQASAPSASLAQGPLTGSIVLPPLATPSLPVDLPVAEEAWTPEGVGTGQSLPSRQRVAPQASVDETPEEETPIIDVGTRTTLFSSFRSMEDLDSTLTPPNPVELEPAPDVTATDISLPALDAETLSGLDTVHPDSGTQQIAVAVNVADSAALDVTTPEPVGEVPAPAHRGDVQGFAPASPARGAWQDGDTMVDGVTVAEPVLPDLPEPGAGDLTGRAPSAYAASAESAEAASIAEPATIEPVPDELTFEALPKFEELMADLPTRRSLREESGRRRGLFGRRPRATTNAAPFPGEARPASGALRSQPAVAPGDQRVSIQDGTGAVPAHAVVTSLDAPPPGVEDAVARGRAVGASESIVREPASSNRPVPARTTPFVSAEAAIDVAPGGLPSAVPGHVPEQVNVLDGYRSFEPPVPLARRPATDAPVRPADEYPNDSVEARSDWMASAVLYEEMSSLLRTNAEVGAAADNGGGSRSYEPVKVEGGPQGLTRRSRAQVREGYVDRFTASIERDPEQLRARLAAFQSATARGRAEAQDD